MIITLITKTDLKPSKTPLGAVRKGPDLAVLAEDWLTTKTVGDRPGDKGHSDRARRGDLVRWAAGYARVLNPARNVSGGGLDVWSMVPVAKLGDADVAVEVLKLFAADGLALSSRQRLLATFRGWCAWLARRGHIDVDPATADEVSLRGSERGIEGKAFTLEDVAQLAAAAGRAPSPRERSPWPTRDVAIVSILAGCGLRVSELCALAIKSYDTTGEQALLRLRDTKGGKGRTVPVPGDTVIDIDRYLDERSEHASEVRALAVTSKALVFVGNNGRPLTQQFVDSALRRCCDRAAIGYPDGAMAHALRHHYGTQLASNAPPQSTPVFHRRRSRWRSRHPNPCCRTCTSTPTTQAHPRIRLRYRTGLTRTCRRVSRR